jgi:hypothetical protein
VLEVVEPCLKWHGVIRSTWNKFTCPVLQRESASIFGTEARGAGACARSASRQSYGECRRRDRALAIDRGLVRRESGEEADVQAVRRSFRLKQGACAVCRGMSRPASGAVL